MSPQLSPYLSFVNDMAGLPTPVPVDPVVTLVIFCIGASAAIVVLALMRSETPLESDQFTQDYDPIPVMRVPSSLPLSKIAFPPRYSAVAIATHASGVHGPRSPEHRDRITTIV